MVDTATDVPWWQDAVFYQIYPLSFSDSSGNGFGDLAGVISKLNYLSDTLGVDALWLSPFFKSPMRDWGYDISDHCAVDPLFGTLADAKRLIDAVHSRGMKIIIEYAINQTSDQHLWFIESRSSRDDPKRDWYVWRDGRNGGPPTNWVSVFSGPAWSHDQRTGQWYRHTYLSAQPDLNWRNPDVVEAMLDVGRFWLDLGVDGFRVDAAHQMMKDPLERDNPPAPPDYPRPYKDMGEYDRFIHLYDFGHPDVHEAHRQIRRLLDSYDRDAVSVGEIHIFDLSEWASYYGESFDQLHMPFNFHLMASDWDAPSLRANIEAVLWNVPSGGWTNWTMGNHDEIRMASRLPAGHERLAAMLLLTLRGSPFLYYGDELGMPQVEMAPGSGRDPWGLNVEYLSRDGCRTPMRWSPRDGAGFTEDDVQPWLPVGEGLEEVNVQTQLDDPESLLNLYRRLLFKRRASPALRVGSYESLDSEDPNVFMFRRRRGAELATIILNLGETSTEVLAGRGTVAVSTLESERDDMFDGSISLAAGEGVIIDH